MALSPNNKDDRISNVGTFEFVEDDDLGNLNFKITRFKLPEVYADTVKISNPITEHLAQNGDYLSHEDLVLEFIVDEDLDNYYKLKDWINKATNPAYIKNNEIDKSAILKIYNNRNKPLFSILFRHLKAKRISGFDFPPVDPRKVVKCIVTFEYLYDEKLDDNNKPTIVEP